MGLAIVVLAALSAQIWWECRRIRAQLADMGLCLTSIRWLPLQPLLDGRWSRRHMYYRIRYLDRSGAPFTATAVWTLFRGLSLEGQRPLVAARGGAVARGGFAPPWLASACSLAGCLAIGFEYWAGAYNQTSLPSGLYTFGLLLVAAAAAVLQVVQPSRWRSTLPILALAPVATVVVRIALDLARDPTTHNLLPFEIVIAGIVGGAVSLAGSAVGWLAGRWIGPPTARATVRIGSPRSRR
jgi:hypothetical protein